MMELHRQQLWTAGGLARVMLVCYSTVLCLVREDYFNV